MSLDLDAIKRRFIRFAEIEAGNYSGWYRGLAHAVAADDDLVRFIAAMPDQQPNLFLASIQWDRRLRNANLRKGSRSSL